MKYVPDKTGRFKNRPHYEPAELDLECEKIITEFMKVGYGGLILPIATDALTRLIEQDAQDLDLYADLSVEGPEVQGVTDFFSGKKPKVRIAKELSEDRSRENRLTTLTHEYGHVKFHGFLWQMDTQSPQMFPEFLSKSSPKCKRDAILNAPYTDWMEWQAGYICGALLMPITYIRRTVTVFFEENNLLGPLKETSAEASDLKAVIAETFQVSIDAARVRLLKLKHLSGSEVSPSLFK